MEFPNEALLIFALMVRGRLRVELDGSALLAAAGSTERDERVKKYLTKILMLHW